MTAKTFNENIMISTIQNDKQQILMRLSKRIRYRNANNVGICVSRFLLKIKVYPFVCNM